MLINGVPVAVEDIDWRENVMHLPGGVRVTFGGPLDHLPPDVRQQIDEARRDAAAAGIGWPSDQAIADLLAPNPQPAAPTELADAIRALRSVTLRYALDPSIGNRHERRRRAAMARRT